VLPDAQMLAPNGVERPEVEVGVLYVHRVGAARSRGRRAPGQGRGRAAGGGEADEAAAQGAGSRPSHTALRPCSRPPPPPPLPVGVPYMIYEN